jgi:RNA polymerase sigma-B factor
MGELTTPVHDAMELARRWQEDGDQRARSELFEQFLPLARKLAGRYASPYESLDDLVQVASIGLLGAVDRFDPKRGVRFSAFAIPTILGELKRYFRNTGWSAHVPRGAQEMTLRVRRASRQIGSQTGRTPRVDELAEYMEVGVEDAMVGLHAGMAQFSTSLDAPVPGIEPDDLPSLVDSLGVGDDGFGLVETKLSLPAAITRLPYVERQALSLRIDHRMKQADIARTLGCSQMQVSRLLHRAATHIRDLTDPDLSTMQTDGCGACPK